MSIRLARASGDALGKLQRGLRVSERPPLLRLALAVGIRHCDGELPVAQDSKGPEIPVKVITAGQDLLMDALIVNTLGQNFGSASDRRRVYKHLVDFGLMKMLADYEASENRGDYLVSLAKICLSRETA